MAKYSIICCISNEKVYDECLLKSVYKHRYNHDIDIIPIINNDNRYSASNALNVGIDISKSKYLVFAHQDVEMLDNWFDKLENIIDNLDNEWAIIGSAGIGKQYGIKDVGRWGGSLHEHTLAVGTVYDSDKANTPYWNGSKETQLIHCVDECLFVLKANLGLRFDPQFNGFHFYGVDLCLQARSAGYGVYGGHLPIIHYGKYSASLINNNRYWIYYRHLYNKWGQRFPELLGTHMHWGPDGFVSYINLSLTDEQQNTAKIKSMGIKKIEVRND